jgi:hypothetical protein
VVVGPVVARRRRALLQKQLKVKNIIGFFVLFLSCHILNIFCSIKNIVSQTTTKRVEQGETFSRSRMGTAS